MPVVLIPIQFDRQIYLNDHEEINNHVNERIIPLTRFRSIASSFQHSVVLRTFLTKDFMTGRPAVPGETFPHEMIDEMCQTIKTNVPGISRILYDLTSKPPGKKEFINIFIYNFLLLSNDRMGIKNSQNSAIYKKNFFLLLLSSVKTFNILFFSCVKKNEKRSDINDRNKFCLKKYISIYFNIIKPI